MNYKRLRLSDQKLNMSDFVDEEGQQMVSFLNDCHVLYKAAYIDISDFKEVYGGLQTEEVFAGLYIPHLDKLLPVGLNRQLKDGVERQLRVENGNIIITEI